MLDLRYGFILSRTHRMNHRKAFTLVELSIVLVILGLLVGGILAGQSLIRSAELKKFWRDIDQYRTATMAFRDKYQALPGDMQNAISFWGRAGADAGWVCRDTDSTTLADPRQTCNGDGDGFVMSESTTHYSQEMFRYWQHLANAGLISGKFTGKNYPVGFPMGVAPGVNSPTTPFGGQIGMMLVYYPPTQSPIFATSFTTVQYGHSFVIGSINNSNYVPTTGFMPVHEMYLFDSKYDDGMPGTGKILPTNARFENCVTGGAYTNPAATYFITTNNGACGVTLRDQF